MDTRYRLGEIQFIWDASKADVNVKKHSGITFEQACETFFDPFLQVVDAGVVERESREAVIGTTENWRLMYVVYILRDDEIRIISARSATKSERSIYENR